uniref:Transferase n=1 Tax=Rhizophora mucronata TaxID=61149 RepID=A0A2P2NLF7_RHIMU
MAWLQFAVGARNKMVPPVPRCFSGNDYVLASIALSAEEMEEGGYEAIIETIKLC